MTQPDISILICTRNRGAGLGDTLASVTQAALQAPSIAIEAIIVDNGSTDDTPEVIDRWASEQTFPVIQEREQRPGLATARNAGLRHVSGRILAMTDDDCVLHPDYLLRLSEVFAERDGPAVIGGRIELGDPGDLKVTIKTDPQPAQFESRRYPGGFIMGANLAMTADVHAIAGDFDERFGAGARFIAGEDSEFMLRATANGIPLLYDPRFAVDHFHGRRRHEEMIKLAKGYYYGDGAVFAKHLGRDLRILRAIKGDVWMAVKDIWAPYTSSFGIERFFQFKLRHELRGFATFLLSERFKRNR